MFPKVIRNVLVVLLWLNLPHAALSQDRKSVPSGRVTVLEEVITTSVVFKSSSLFSSSEENVQISAVLWTPEEKFGFKKPYPLVVYSHGSQDTGTDLQIKPFGPVAFFLSQGVAVYVPVRKGFFRKGEASSLFSVDRSEPVACVFGLLDSGVKSAKQDTAALVAQLKGREDIDLNRVVLMGQSRGGFLSLSLAADNFPGLVGVLNFSGGWHGESCPQSYNYTKMSEFGDKINVPVLSVYGDTDRYFSPLHIKGYLKALAKNGKSEGVILEGYNHVRPIGDTQVWGERAMQMFNGK